MDTSGSKALIMVASVLLAMIVIAFVTFSLGRVRQWAETEDSEIVIEQAQKFNKEYEVYDKDLMYGVDIISCLNKAKSNNDMITDERIVNGNTYDSSYEVQVQVKLKEKSAGKASLSESIKVYHMGNTASNAQIEYATGGPTEGAKKLKDLDGVGIKYWNTKYKNLTGTIFDGELVLQSKTGAIEVQTPLVLTKDSNQNSDVIKLLEASKSVSQVVKNQDSASRQSISGWTTAEFRTALYDLKTRKFKCTNIEYNSNTGRINKLEFEEF